MYSLKLVLIFLIVAPITIGQNWLDSETAGSSTNDAGNLVRIDNNGTMYIHGSAKSGSSFDSLSFNYDGNFIAKYSTSGIAEWVIPCGETLQLTSMNRQTNGGMEIDNSGNIYVAGNFSDTCLVGDSTIIGNSTNFNAFIAKINSSGIVQWTKYVTNNSVITGIAIDSSENIVICGYTEGVTSFDGTTITPYGSGTRDIVFARYDNTGNFQWVQQCGGPGFYPDRAFAVACDNQNNIYVGGHIRSDSDFDGLTLLSTAPSQSYYNGFITKYDSLGQAVWVEYCGYTCSAIKWSNSGSLYVAGYSGISPNNGYDGVLTAQSDKFFVAKMTDGGTYLWGNSNSGTGISGCSDLALDASENCYVTGHYTDTALFNTDTIPGNPGAIWYTHMFCAKYDSSGNELWVDHAGGNTGSNTWGFGIDATDTCKYAVCGSFQSPPEVIHIDTLYSYGAYDVYFSYHLESCSISVDSLIPDTPYLPDIISECPVSPPVPTATNNSGTYNGTPDTSLPITASGTTVITWTYDDGNGNTSTQAQNVIITPIDVNTTTTLNGNNYDIAADASGYNYQWIEDCGNANVTIAGAINQTYTPTANGSYAVIIDNGTCSDTSACVVIDDLGIEDTQLSNITLSPNPTTGMYTINLGMNYSEVDFTLYNNKGKVLDQKELSNIQIINEKLTLEPGLYYVQLKLNNDQSKVLRIVKQ